MNFAQHSLSAAQLCDFSRCTILESDFDRLVALDVAAATRFVKHGIGGQEESRSQTDRHGTFHPFISSTQPPAENQTKVKWGFTGKMPYPMNLMCAFMDMDKMIGGDLQKGLDNLKVVLEK